MHLVGFIIRIYHDARTPERRICSSDKFNTLHPSRKKELHYTSLAEDAKEHKTEKRWQTQCGGGGLPP